MSDDPEGFSRHAQGQEQIEVFKNVISDSEHIVEIKFGSVQFTSDLVIILSNATPEALADTAGPAKEAIYDRLAGTRSITRSTLFVPNSDYARRTLPKKIANICHIVARDRHDTIINTRAVCESLPAYKDMYAEIY